MIIRFILTILILLAGCGQKIKTDDKKTESIKPASNLTDIIDITLEKRSITKSQVPSRPNNRIQAKSKIYQSLQSVGITIKNLDFFFNSDPNIRNLMHEKLINTRDPYHLYLVWQRIKEILEKDKWRVGFNETITVLWNSCDKPLRNQIINHLLTKPKLSKIGRAPWMAGEWLQSLKVGLEYDLRLLEILKTNQHPSRQWVRNYLSKRYNKNFGSNYLIWKQYLERN